MADAIGQNVQDVINETGIIGAINNVISSVGDLQKSIADTNSKQIDVVVNLQGAEGLTEVNTRLIEVQQTITSYVAAQRQAAQIQQQSTQINTEYGASISELSKELGLMRNDYDATKERIKQLNEAVQAGTISQKNYITQLTAVTEANVRLKQEINETTKAITSQTEIGLARQLEALEKASNAQQAREVKAIQSAERIANVEQASAIKRANAFEAAAIREQIAAIKTGNAIQAAKDKEIIANERATISYQVLAKAKNMAFRFPALLVELAIFALLFAAIEKISTAFMESIPGTDAFIAKQEKITQATDALKSSFEQLGDELEKYFEQQRRIWDFEEGHALEALKRIEDQTKMKGGAESANAQQHAASESRRKEEIASINQQINLYTKLQDALTKVVNSNKGYTSSKLVNSVKNEFLDDGLPTDFFSKIKADIDKSLKDIGKASDAQKVNIIRGVLSGANINYGIKVQDLNNKRSGIQDESSNDEAAQRNSAYDKRIELEKTLANLHEQLREANEKEDVASVDRVVRDIKKKYELAANEIRKNWKIFDENYTGDKYSDSYQDYKEAVGKQLSALSSINNRNKHNVAFEEGRREFFSQEDQSAAEAAGRGNIAGGNASFGNMSYGKSAAAQDAQTAAKLESARVQFEKLADTYRQGGQSTAEIEKQNQQNITLIYQHAYKDRLGLASAYFQSAAQRIDAVTGGALGANAQAHFSGMTSILLGRGTDADKEYSLFKENIGYQKADENEKLSGVNKKIPAAQSAFNTNAANAANPSLSDESRQEARKSKEQAKDNLQELYTQQAEHTHNLIDLDKQLADKKKSYQEQIRDTAINLAKETVSAIATINDNQIAAQQQQLDIKQRSIELQSQQEMQAIEATAGFAVTKDNEKAKLAAQTAAQENAIQQQSNQLALKKAKADKTAAEASVIINTATAITKAFADFPYPVALPIAALLAATGAVQFAAAASTPLPQFAEGVRDFGGGKAILGDGFEKEFVSTPSGSFWSGDKPAVYDLPKGTDVTPMSKMIDYAQANVANSKRYDMQAIYNNDMIMKEVAKIIGDKVMETGGDTVRAIYSTASRKINNIVIIKGNDLQRKA